MKFYDIQQNEEEWDLRRIDKATSSSFGTVMANDGKAFGDPARKYAMKIALEAKTGVKLVTYNNKFMDRGHEFEPMAREQYEEDTLTVVTNGGFAEEGNWGSSSDGLVGKDGMIEIKSVIFTTQFANIKVGYDKAYRWQMQGQMFVYQRKWCDFCSFCPEFPKGKQLHIFRVDRDDEMISKLEPRLLKFWEMVEEYKEILNANS